MPIHLLALLLAAPAQAGEVEQRGIFPYAIESHTLDNGLRVHAVPMASPGAVAWATWMAVGSRDEVDEGRTGFAHFFEHLMFFGTETLGAEAREREILRLGIEENAWTWLDETVYHATLAAPHLPRYAAIEADRFQRLHLTEDDVRKEAGAVYGEWRKSQADPDTKLWELLYATAFSTHTYGHDTLGHLADIQQMPTAHAYSAAFFDRFYRPEHATILAVGDLEPEAVFALVEEQFGDWEPGTEPRPEVPQEPPQEEIRRVELPWATPTATRLAMGWRIARHSEASAPIQLASDLLFAPTGPLKNRLVREEALAYAVHGGNDSFVDPGLFQVHVRLKDGVDPAAVEAIVREEIAALAAGPEPETLERTRSHSRYGWVTSLHDPASVMDALGWALRRDPDPAALDRFYVHYDAQTPETVAAAVREVFVDANLTVVLLRHEATPEVAE